MKREDLFYAIEEEASYQKLIDVLCSVVELHNPIINALPDETCSACQDLYPCRTIQAIEKELG